RAAVVDGPPELPAADRNRDRVAGVGPPLAAPQALGVVHRDRTHGRPAEMLRDLEHQPVALVLGLQRVEDRRQMVVELHVDDGADDLGDASYGIGHFVLVAFSSYQGAAGATAPRRRR